MSAYDLKDRVIAALVKQRDLKVTHLRRCKPTPATIVEGAVVPASSAESIALYAVDTNATIDALNLAIETVEGEFKRLMSPEEPSEPDTVTVMPKRSLYGN